MFRKERGFIPHLKKGAGFTLIELLIVIAVIGILAAAILPRYVSFSDDAAVGATKGALSSLRAALVIYVAKNDGYYPPTPAEVESGLVPDYIDFIPPEQVEFDTTSTAYSAVKGDEDNTISVAYDAAGDGWIYVYETDPIRARFCVNEAYLSAVW